MVDKTADKTGPLTPGELLAGDDIDHDNDNDNDSYNSPEQSPAEDTSVVLPTIRETRASVDHGHSVISSSTNNVVNSDADAEGTGNDTSTNTKSSSDIDINHREALAGLQKLQISPALSSSSSITDASPALTSIDLSQLSQQRTVPESSIIAHKIPRYRRLSDSMPPPSDPTGFLPKDIDSEDDSSSSDDESDSDDSSSDDEHFQMLPSTSTTQVHSHAQKQTQKQTSRENSSGSPSETSKDVPSQEVDQPDEEGSATDSDSRELSPTTTTTAENTKSNSTSSGSSIAGGSGSSDVIDLSKPAGSSLTIETPGSKPRGSGKKKGKMKRPASPMLMPQDLYDYEVYRTKIIYPSTAFDENGDLDEEIPYTSANEEALDAKKALNMTIEVSQVGSDQAAKRMVRTIERGSKDMVPLSQMKDSDVMGLKSYVVATDLSPESSYALEWTIGTIIRDGDILFAVCAFEDDPAEHAPQQEGERLDAVQKITDRIVELLKKTRLQVHVIIEVLHCKSPKHLLTDIIDYVNPTLVILGSRGRGALKGVLLGSFSKYIVERSSVPVMVARRKLHKPSNKHLKVRLANNLRTPGLEYANAI